MAPKTYSFFGVLFVMLFMGTTQSQPATHNNHPFGFIRNLTRGHKGEIVPGLSELKQYLQKFGYLNSEPLPVVDAADAQSNANNDLSATAVESEDYFDDAVEAAIKTYQLNYNLPVTGTLDPMTVRQMMLPRCGFPDIINRTTASFQPGDDENHDHDHNRNLLIHGVSHYSFFPGSPRWSKNQLTYRFLTEVQVPGTSNIRAICARAFQKWASVTRFTFTEVPGNVQSDMQIGFFRGSHGDNLPFDGNGGVIAHAYAPTNGQFHYDADEYWSENPNFQQMDLESVAMHEIGHLLGLGHSDVQAASMYPSFSSGERKRELNTDDIQGIRALYP